MSSPYLTPHVNEAAYLLCLQREATRDRELFPEYQKRGRRTWFLFPAELAAHLSDLDAGLAVVNLRDYQDAVETCKDVINDPTYQ